LTSLTQVIGTHRNFKYVIYNLASIGSPIAEKDQVVSLFGNLSVCLCILARSQVLR